MSVSVYSANLWCKIEVAGYRRGYYLTSTALASAVTVFIVKIINM